MSKSEVCEKCKGTGRYAYDEQHIKPCEACCVHSDGWWKLDKRHGEDAGKYACKIGCGTLQDSTPQNEDDLLELTRQALADVIGREPTRQEILRTHTGFKRMAFLMMDHLKKEEGVVKETPRNAKLSRK